MGADADATAHDRSRAVWDAMAAGWEAGRERLWEDSAPVSERLIDTLNPQPGQTLLELAAGLGETGLVAARRLGETGRVIITDFAPEMVAAARRRATEFGITNVAFQVLDAERMDLATDSVDGVLCRWGYMLMIHPAAAFAETRRVLRPDGRLAFSVFASPQANPWASVIGRILVERGHLAPPDPAAPGIFAFADPGRIGDMVMDAGFATPTIDEVELRLRFADLEAYWAFLTEMAGAISPILRALPADDRREVRAQLEDAMAAFTTDAGYVIPGACLNVATH
jgi:ubiquinone/menaquinone biosynthesis C-methylase UbiE